MMTPDYEVPDVWCTVREAVKPRLALLDWRVCGDIVDRVRLAGLELEEAVYDAIGPGEPTP